MPGSTNLALIDYAFIGSTYLGDRSQVDTGKPGETQAADPTVKAYVRLMDTSDVQVEDQLAALLKKMGVTQPTLTLIQGGYATIVCSQKDYQRANDALYR